MSSDSYYDILVASLRVTLHFTQIDSMSLSTSVIRIASLSNIRACLSGTPQVFQRRYDGSVDFFRNWADYKKGFGTASGEFWMGNDIIHSLTRNGNHVLRIDMEAFDGETRFIQVNGFSVGDESTNYTLRFTSYLNSSAAGELNKNYCAAHVCSHIHAVSMRNLTCAHTHERVQNQK